VISYDTENDADIVALIACSAALTLSGIPFMGPIGAARVGYKDGEYILNPTKIEMDDSELDLVVAGTKDAVLMVESEAKELSEEVMLGAVTYGQENFVPIIEAIISLAEKSAKEPRDFTKEDLSELENKVSVVIKDQLTDAYKEADKQKRTELIAEVKSNLIDQFSKEDSEGDEEYSENALGSVFKNIEKSIVRNSILDTSLRIEGRDLKTLTSDCIGLTVSRSLPSIRKLVSKILFLTMLFSIFLKTDPNAFSLYSSSPSESSLEN
jgi:polyribonucleotide nucleotidyltransferase